jgi:hypothetical protein
MLGHDWIKAPFLEDNKACQTRQHNMKNKSNESSGCGEPC